MNNSKSNSPQPAAETGANQKREVADRFGKHAEGYARSIGHAQGPDLVMLVTLLNPRSHWHVLDVATGAGHTAARHCPLLSKK